LWRREPLQPVVEVLDQAALVVVHVDGGGDVHRVYEAEPIRDPALAHELLDLRRDVQVPAPLRNLEPELLARVVHAPRLTGQRVSQRACSGRSSTATSSWLIEPRISPTNEPRCAWTATSSRPQQRKRRSPGRTCTGRGPSRRR